ncbi:MAG: aspartate 1-decarboxylase [Pseudomonadota bacterium]
MLLNILKSKLHGAEITRTDLHYEGSISIDANLLEAADMLPFEQVEIWNVTNGARLSTYIIEGERGSGEVMLNGAAARLAEVGDTVIIAAYAQLTPDEVRDHRPTIVLMGPDNSVSEINRS